MTSQGGGPIVNRGFDCACAADPLTCPKLWRQTKSHASCRACGGQHRPHAPTCAKSTWYNKTHGEKKTADAQKARAQCERALAQSPTRNPGSMYTREASEASAQTVSQAAVALQYSPVIAAQQAAAAALPQQTAPEMQSAPVVAAQPPAAAAPRDSGASAARRGCGEGRDPRRDCQGLR